MRAAPPVVMIHGLAHGRAALAPRLPVTLLSAPAAALFAGPPWWIALLASLRAEHAGFAFDDVLDCGDAPGLAAQALRLGQCRILFAGGTPALAVAIAALAAGCGAHVWTDAPPALDLAEPDAERRLASWLGAPRQGDKDGGFR
ncbi:hypothetical protein [Acidisoma sp. 7E03]